MTDRLASNSETGGRRRGRGGRPPSGRQRLERAIELYQREFYRTRSVSRVSELAERLGANRPHLSRIVGQILGKPLGDALRERQLAYAAELLVETRLRIAEIANAAAFGTERTFFRAFKRIYGQTPAEYRTQKSNEMSVDDRCAKSNQMSVDDRRRSR